LLQKTQSLAYVKYVSSLRFFYALYPPSSRLSDREWTSGVGKIVKMEKEEGNVSGPAPNRSGTGETSIC
jgi:hypothetical protein